MSSSTTLQPTYFGHIASTADALILFELCLAGNLNHVARRPHDRERTNLIKSGNVFIYEEHSSGIKRWTDGIAWSPSRILGNFLVYRELERPFPPGEKKRAMKRGRNSPSGISKQDPYGSSGSSISTGYNPNPSLSAPDGTGGISKEAERRLIGSLVDSYGFKEEGLVKKTVSVTIGSVSHHLVSYYSVADASSGRLNVPTKDPRFEKVVPRPELLNKQNFRVSIDEIESMDRVDDRPMPYGNGYAPYQSSTYNRTNQSLTTHRPLPPPHISMSYAGQHHGGYSNYGMSITPTVPSYNNHTQYAQQFPHPHVVYPNPIKSESYDPNAYRETNSYRPPQRSSSTAGLGSDMTRVNLGPAAPHSDRRNSSYSQNHNLDAGLTSMPTPSSMESKLTNDSGYSSSHNQNYFASREVDNNRYNLPPVVPTQQASYDQTPIHNSYGMSSNSETRDPNLWPGGNASSGHAHYLTSQSNWSNIGSS